MSTSRTSSSRKSVPIPGHSTSRVQRERGTKVHVYMCLYIVLHAVCMSWIYQAGKLHLTLSLIQLLDINEVPMTFKRKRRAAAGNHGNITIYCCTPMHPYTHAQTHIHLLQISSYQLEERQRRLVLPPRVNQRPPLPPSPSPHQTTQLVLVSSIPRQPLGEGAWLQVKGAECPVEMDRKGLLSWPCTYLDLLVPWTPRDPRLVHGGVHTEE